MAVTILTDSLGLKREYEHVKRPAQVGERILIVKSNWSYGFYGNGDILTVEKLPSTTGVRANGIPIYISHSEYVVLVETDIVVIDDKRYRLVERLPRIGESIVLLDNTVLGRKRGEIVPIYYVGMAYQNTSYYRVLKPVNDLIKSGEKFTDIIANLATKYVELENRVCTLERSLSGKTTVQPPQPFQPSHDVIERAKRDVTELLNNNYVNINVWFVDNKPYTGISATDKCEFIINRERRTVVALIRGLWGNQVQLRGIAKCSEYDEFNEDIGKAIALRRALKLSVPVEYTDAPLPEYTDGDSH